jgi:hypothetical protein
VLGLLCGLDYLPMLLTLRLGLLLYLPHRLVLVLMLILVLVLIILLYLLGSQVLKTIDIERI